jgi:hypothetical protein
MKNEKKKKKSGKKKMSFTWGKPLSYSRGRGIFPYAVWTIAQLLSIKCCRSDNNSCHLESPNRVPAPMRISPVNPHHSSKIAVSITIL